MNIKPSAELYVDFPDDVVEEDGEIVDFGGRLVAETIAAIMERLGYVVSALENQAESGWDFDVQVEGKRVWMRVHYPGDDALLFFTEYYPGFRLFKKANNQPYAEALTRLNAELAKDPRFREIRWKSHAQILDGTAGSKAPVS